jgi:hypothetical protein
MALKAADLADKSKVFNEIQKTYSAQTRNYHLENLKPVQGTTWRAPPDAWLNKALSKDAFSVTIGSVSGHAYYQVNIIAKDKDKPNQDITYSVGSLGY